MTYVSYKRKAEPPLGYEASPAIYETVVLGKILHRWC